MFRPAWVVKERKTIGTQLLQDLTTKPSKLLEALPPSFYVTNETLPNSSMHRQPSVNVPQSRTMAGGEGAGGASDGDKSEGAGSGASQHADKHSQSSVNAWFSGMM